jgi:hypothetical protein
MSESRVRVGNFEIGRTAAPQFLTVKDHYREFNHPIMGAGMLEWGVFPVGSPLPVASAATIDRAYDLAREMSRSLEASDE